MVGIPPAGRLSEIGFVLHDSPTSRAPCGPGPPGPAWNWVRFAHSASPRRRPPDVPSCPSLALFCMIGPRDRSRPRLHGANWLRFARLAPRIGFVSRIFDLPGSGPPAKLGSFCTIGLRRADVAGGRAGIPPQVCSQSAIRNRGIGFVLHDWPARGRGDRPRGASRRRSVPNPQSKIRNREIGFVLRTCLPHGWQRQGLRPVRGARGRPSPPGPRPPSAPEIGFVLRSWSSKLGSFYTFSLRPTVLWRRPTRHCRELSLFRAIGLADAAPQMSHPAQVWLCFA
jgi:hypothetical protein